MTSYKIYSDEQYRAFLKNKFSTNYGISEEKAADWFMNQAGARAVINSYGVTKQMLLDELIPTLKEKLGGYMFFLMYTVTEGGGAGNWINHYGRDTASGAKGTLVADCDYLLSVNEQYNGLPVAMTAPEVGGSPPQDKINEAQNVYNECGKDSIGAVMMPSTMAGNAWVFAEDWCLANQGSSAPAVYFGNPYNQMIDAIKDAGGDPFDGKADGGKPSAGQKPGNKNGAGNNKKSGGGFFYLQNSMAWNFGGVVSGNSSRTGDSGSKSGGGDSKPANNSTSFSSEEDQKLWKETENENPGNAAGLTDHVRHVRAFMMKKFGLGDVQGYNPASDDGTGHGHNMGLALDFMVNGSGSPDHDLGQKIADYMTTNFDALKVYYVIWEQHFYMDVTNIYGPPNQWNAMPDRGGITANHFDHVHVSFKE